ncbi:hypothetical protein P4O66_022894 [Electrophorus voltai]|uniref:Calreticulin n=1 Tax=Electrophorus voltai TaxID=2609070 RepID=A0AAD9E1T5_9TELE|nr:hypothetical protein P4O66_022894 [Electrophorus voltai]
MTTLSLLMTTISLAVIAAESSVYFREQFEDGDNWKTQWVESKHKSDYGKFVLSAGKFYGDAEKDKGLQTSQDARFYSVSSRFKDFSNKDQPLVVQFTVKHEQSIDCGGGYIKLFPSDLNQEDMHGDSTYNLMFGPDICGPGTKKVHVIFNYKGKNHLINKDIRCKDDEYTHLYTLIVNPDNTYEVKIDNKKVESGSLEADWDFLPPRKVKDPDAKKPEDWDEREKIDDPDDKKPEDWDKPENIPDPDAKKPDDWDDEMDGEWEPPMVTNPEYNGEWKPKQIDNPAYKGKWVHPEIDNPEYTPDPEIYKYNSIAVIGLDLWQVKSGTIFDNFLITNDPKLAEEVGNETWGATKLSSGNPVYDKFYRQVDPSGSGRVAATEAASFLKRSGLSDLVLGKVWDLADSERKGFLNKQQFFVALRLVACAQNGLEVGLKSLNVAVPPPKFESSACEVNVPSLPFPDQQDTSSPLLAGAVPVDGPWVVKPEEKMKFDSIFDSLSPVAGTLTGDKVKPVLLNSKLPVDVLGRVWELSDIDRDGMLDKDEFAVAMYLVYRALENEPVPTALPPSLVPPSKRQKINPPPVMPLLPSPPSIKERTSSQSGSKTLPAKPTQPQWAVSPADKAKYDEVFAKTDSDMDGLVSGPEVRDIFLKTGLPSATLARIWELCDIGDIGKLTKEQFALALHLINQKLSKGIDPPQVLSPEMIPPSDRLSRQNSAASCQAADFSAIKELDSLSNEIMDLQRPFLGVAGPSEVRAPCDSPALPHPAEWEGCKVAQTPPVPTVCLERGQMAGLGSNQLPPATVEADMVLEGEAVQPAAGWLSVPSVATVIKYSCLCWSFREKSSVEQEIKEKEETIRQRTSEVQDLQDEVQKESGELRRLQAERQEVQEVLERLDEQKSSLEEQLQLIQQQCSQESQLLQSLEAEHLEQEQRIGDYEEELVRAREELLRLQEETRTLGERVQSARAQLCPLQDAVTESHTQITQVQERLTELKTEEREVTAQLTWKVLEEDPPALVNGIALPAAQPKLVQWPQPMEQPLAKPKEEEGDEDIAPVDEPQELKVMEEQPDVEFSELPSSPEEPEPSTEAQGDQHPSTQSPAFPIAATTTWPHDHTESASSTPAIEPEVKGPELKQQPSTSTVKVSLLIFSVIVLHQWVESPGLEKKGETTPPIVAHSGSPPSSLDFFQSDPFMDSDPFKDDDLFSKVDVSDPFGGDPFKGTDPFATDSFFKQSSSSAFPAGDPFTSSDPFALNSGPSEPDLFSSRPNNAGESDPFSSRAGTVVATDPFGSASGNVSFASKTDVLADSDPFSSAAGTGDDPFGGSSSSEKDTPAAANDPFAPGGTAVNADSDPDPFATVFGTETFGGGFADFSSLAKSNDADPFATSNTHSKNLFREDNQSDVPPALPPKTGTPTRPPPPPPGKRSNVYRSDSSDSFQKRGLFGVQGSGEFSSLPAKDAVPDPFAPSAPCQVPRDPDRFATFDKYPTEEDMIEWAKRESEREERERVARLTQQEQEDLELAIALSKSELS